MQTALASYVSACSESKSTLLFAASPTTRSLSGRREMISSAWVPMEPVEPRMTTFFMSENPKSLQVYQCRLKGCWAGFCTVGPENGPTDFGRSLLGDLPERRAYNPVQSHTTDRIDDRLGADIDR